MTIDKQQHGCFRIYSEWGRALINRDSREHLSWHTMQLLTAPLPPIPQGAEEFAHGHMHGTGARDDVLIVVGCRYVEYVGRAQSTLGWSERVGIGMVTALGTLVTLEVAAENEMDITS